MKEVIGLFTLGGLLHVSSVAFGIAMYIFSALGLYTIAKRRGIANPWLAWIPVGNAWILGSISDQYQLSVKNKKTSRRKILLAVNIIPMIIAIILVIAVVVMTVQLVAISDYYVPQTVNPYPYGDASQYHYNISSTAGSLLGSLAGILILSLVLLAVSVVSAVFMYMSYYDLYMSSSPSNAVVFLVLGIVIGFLNNIFVFVCKDMDEGMRPPAAPRWEYPLPPV